LTRHAAGASPFPRHWLYAGDAALAKKSAVMPQRFVE
jgi:hypothetical protein